MAKKEDEIIQMTPEALKCIRDFVYHLSMASFSLENLHVESNESEKISDETYIAFLKHKDFIENDLIDILYDDKRIHILVASVGTFLKRNMKQLADVFDDYEVLENIILNVDDEKLLNDMEGHLK